MKFSRDQIIELSHPLYCRKEHFEYNANLAPDSRMLPDNWYVEGIATLAAHAGTHVEVPYHHMLSGRDCMTYPLENLIGEAIVINCEGKEAGAAITLEDVKQAEGIIEVGDIVFLHTGYDAFYREENWQPYPYLSIEALQWLLQYNPKAIGTDASGVELTDGYDEKGRMHELYGEPVHVACFERGVAIVESLTNLGAVGDGRVNVWILPLRMQGMDASPVRIVAMRI